MECRGFQGGSQPSPCAFTQQLLKDRLTETGWKNSVKEKYVLGNLDIGQSSERSCNRCSSTLILLPLQMPPNSKGERCQEHQCQRSF